VPAALVMGAALLAALCAAWAVARLLSSWAMLSDGWSVVLAAGALVLTVVSFPVWFSLAIFFGEYVVAYWRRPWVRRALSKMAERIGARAGVVVWERWGGDGVMAGHFRLSIVAVLPGSPDQVVGELVRRAVGGGYGEPMRPFVPSVRATGVPWWQIEVLTSERAAALRAPVTAGSTAVLLTLTEPR
jgi:hypothetical protein